MALPAEDILQAFFETSALDAVSAEQLQQLAEAYPFYGSAHYLLAKKLYNPEENGTERVLQKAALHFSNELLLHFNLNNTEEAIERIVPASGVGESTNKPAIEPAPLFLNEDLPEEAIPFSEVTEEIILNNKFNTEASEKQEPAIETLHEAETVAADDVAIHDKLSNLLQGQVAAFDKPVAGEEAIPVEITAPHRIDYFESQGIRLQDEKANDKLGTQLRRFTDWLKQMKRINPNPTELISDEAGEHAVQDKAQHSNEPEEIVTETMAEVLIKQGKPEQAINIYEKLSFINPSKSAYFAAKIGELKS